ncbi:MAG TPA: lipopolysaccharide kinase InaA family protein [Phycisphaerales bacterium]|nr:lipopolysaccharide kinase InaA family protein [Phycisphaerales bacterium]HMP36460.1 lipopolysaccharide kinase InaA family protein [Phycisphaerales bacterium]
MPPEFTERCLKEAGLRSVWLVRRPDGGLRTVKAWPMTPGIQLRVLFGASQPQRHARAARRLAAAGVPTPQILSGPAVVRRDGARLLQIELEHVEGSNALEVFLRGDASERAAAASAVAELLRRLVDARLFNRDLKLSNIVIATERRGSPFGALSEPPPRPSGWLLDPVAIRRMRRPRHETARMLERLAIELRERGLAIPKALAAPVIGAARAALPGRRRPCGTG